MGSDKFCTGCGALLKVEDQFCSRCGKDQNINNVPLATSLPPVPVPPPRRGRTSKIVGPLVFIVVMIIVLSVVLNPDMIGAKDYKVGQGNMTYEWDYKDSTYTVSFNLTQSKYLAYVNYEIDNVSVVRHMITTNGFDHGLLFITPEDSVIITLATYMDILSGEAGLNEQETANMVLAFVQTLPYNYDTFTHNLTDYWNYPIETLYEGTGDCEDKSFLYLSIMTAMGYETAILGYPEHVAAGVVCDDASGTYYTKSGVRYYYCETTSIGWTIGMKPDEYGASYIIPVEA